MSVDQFDSTIEHVMLITERIPMYAIAVLLVNISQLFKQNVNDPIFITQITAIGCRVPLF